MKKILLISLFFLGCASPQIKEVNEGVVPGSGAETGLKIETENVQKIIKDLEALDNAMYVYVRTIVKQLTERSMAIKPDEPLPGKLKEEWERASVLSQKLNDLDLFDIANLYLKDLSSTAPSISVRNFARKLYEKRTGEVLRPEMEFTPPEGVTDIYL